MTTLDGLHGGYSADYAEGQSRLDVTDPTGTVTSVRGDLASRIWSLLVRERADARTRMEYNCFCAATYAAGYVDELRWHFSMEALGEPVPLERAVHGGPGIGQFHAPYEKEVDGFSVPDYGPAHAVIVLGEGDDPLLFEKDHKCASGFRRWRDAVARAKFSYHAPLAYSHLPIDRAGILRFQPFRERSSLLSA